MNLYKNGNMELNIKLTAYEAHRLLELIEHDMRIIGRDRELADHLYYKIAGQMNGDKDLKKEE